VAFLDDGDPHKPIGARSSSRQRRVSKVTAATDEKARGNSVRRSRNAERERRLARMHEQLQRGEPVIRRATPAERETS
jgi:hypothetical protein